MSDEALNILNNLTNGEVVTMPISEATEKFREYEAAVKRTHSASDQMMADTFQALKEGKGVIHIMAALKKGGVHVQSGLPKLAISRADEKVVWWRRSGTGGLYGATQTQSRQPHQGSQRAYRQFLVAPGTYPDYNTCKAQLGRELDWGFSETQQAPVPVIPPPLRPKDSRTKYQILFEVNEWKMVPPVDPLLIRPLTNGLAVVVAHWDLTPVERMVMSVLMGN